MKMIEIETICVPIQNDMMDHTIPTSPSTPFDLEPYFDFLDEIEAFDIPKKKPIHYATEFEL